MTNPIKTRIDELFQNTDRDGNLIIKVKPFPWSERKEPYILDCTMDWDAEKCARITAKTLRLYLALDDVQDFYDCCPSLPFGRCEENDFDPDIEEPDEEENEELTESFRIWTELLKSHGITNAKELYSCTSELFSEEGDEVDFMRIAAWLLGGDFDSSIGAGLSLPDASISSDLTLLCVLSQACVKISCANGDNTP